MTTPARRLAGICRESPSETCRPTTVMSSSLTLGCRCPLLMTTTTSRKNCVVLVWNIISSLYAVPEHDSWMYKTHSWAYFQLSEMHSIRTHLCILHYLKLTILILLDMTCFDFDMPSEPWIKRANKSDWKVYCSYCGMFVNRCRGLINFIALHMLYHA